MFKRSLFPAFCLVLPLLAGCGFKPMLKSSNAPLDYHKRTKAKINVRGIEGYLNHKFYQALTHNLSLTNLEKPVVVDVTLSQTFADISYGSDATALRTQNIIVADYEVFENGRSLRKGKVDSISSYNVDQSDEFSTLTSRMGSDEKVIAAIAEEVAREVYIATF